VSWPLPLHYTLILGKNDSSQDADHGYQFDNIGFFDDISILAETPEGMQTLLDVVQEFFYLHNMVWHGDQHKKLSCS